VRKCNSVNDRRNCVALADVLFEEFHSRRRVIEKDEMPDLVPCFKPTLQEPAPVAQTKPEPVEIKPSIEPEPVQPIVEKVQHEVEPYRVIGEAFKTYILVEQGKKLLIIDKHAAHERMLFEKFKANRGSQGYKSHSNRQRWKFCLSHD
jgi:DNA mismatch repair protein MutL